MRHTRVPTRRAPPACFSYLLTSATVHGAGEERRIGRWSAVRKLGWYRRRLAPYLPPHVRKVASQLLLAEGPARPLPPDIDCLVRLRDVFLPDVENLTRRIGRSTFDSEALPSRWWGCFEGS